MTRLSTLTDNSNLKIPGGSEKRDKAGKKKKTKENLTINGEEKGNHFNQTRKNNDVMHKPPQKREKKSDPNLWYVFNFED